MTDDLIHQLIPHQGCVISRTVDGIDIAGSAMNWVMSAGVAPFVCRAPFAFRVVGRTPPKPKAKVGLSGMTLDR